MKHVEKDLQLTGDSVLLRPYQSSDVSHLYEAVRESIAEVSVWMPWCHADYSIEESREWIESQPEKWEQGTDYDFAIIDSENDSFLGGCGLNHINYAAGAANLGYWVRTGRTRRGAATEATLLLARFGFDRLNLNRVEILADVDNRASQRVAEKAGAVREGIMRNRLIVNGKTGDAVMFSLIPRDLKPKASGR